MSGLDLQYIPLNFLQQYFVDKDTGLPLAAGRVYFYRDSARTELKSVYQLSGTAPNYTYTVLPNPLILSGNGTFQDNAGNDITVYLKPYNTSNQVDLYYITVYSSDGVFQESREGVPNIGAGTEATNELTNYIPNGQFLLHNYIPATNTTLEGELVGSYAIVAPGYWTFLRPTLSTSRDLITFERFGSYISNPTANPRYAIRLRCIAASPGDSFKRLYVRFFDVNKFASATQKYTFSFTAKSNNFSNIPVSFSFIKTFGTGGSSSHEEVIQSFNLTTNFVIYKTSFIFGDNSAYSIGALNDDDLLLVINLPLNSTFDLEFTDFMLLSGDIDVNQYPETTNTQHNYRTLLNDFGIYANIINNLAGLPVIVKPEGLRSNIDEVGNIIPTTRQTAGYGTLLCDGSQYETAAYSSEGIPYNRLFNVIGTTYGTGRNFVFTFAATTTDMVMYGNTDGPASSPPSDGTIPPGFTYTNVAVGNLNYGFTGHWQSYHDYAFMEVDLPGTTLNPISAGTSGFLVATYRTGTATSKEIVYFQGVAAASLGGKYFLISNTTTDYYVWFQVSGSDPDPAVPGRTGIMVRLDPADDLVRVSEYCMWALDGFFVERITMGAASTITAGAWFNFYTQTGLHYVVWYKKGGVGTQPVVSGANGYIEVDIVQTDTVTQVVSKTFTAINSKYFAVPDYRGMFLRGWNHGAGIDPEAGLRVSQTSNTLMNGDNIGSFQFDEFRDHTHVAVEAGLYQHKDGSGTGGVWDNFTIPYTTSSTGSYETRPMNVYVNYLIKY